MGNISLTGEEVTPSTSQDVFETVCFFQAFCVLSQEKEDSVVVPDNIKLGQYNIQPPVAVSGRRGSFGGHTANVGSTGVGSSTPTMATKVSWRVTFYPITSTRTCSRFCRCAGYRYWAFSPSRRRCWCKLEIWPINQGYGYTIENTDYGSWILILHGLYRHWIMDTDTHGQIQNTVFLHDK